MSTVLNLSRRGDRGAAAVEFALVLPVLVLLLCGIVEFGSAYNASLAVTHAAREGARLASVGGFNAATVKARAYPLDASSVTVTGPTSGTDAGGGAYYEVTVSYPYQMVIPFWGDRTLDLSSTARMRKE